MKLYKLIQLRLKTYFRNPSFILTLGLFLITLWGILHFTYGDKKDVFVLPIGIVDLDQTTYSELIIERLAKKNTISIKMLSQEEALKQVSTGKLEAVYILNKGLMDGILNGNLNEIIEIVKSPVSLSAEIIGELFSAETMRLSSNVDAANNISRKYGTQNKDGLWDEAWKHTDQYWEPQPPITIDYYSTSQHPTNSDTNTEIAQIKENTSQMLILILLMFSILIATSTLFNEKTNGTLKRIISTGTPLWIYILSIILSIVILHTLGLLMMMLFTQSLWGETTELVRQFILYILYMIWAGALGTAIALLSKKMQHLLIIIPFIALSNGLLIWCIF